MGHHEEDEQGGKLNAKKYDAEELEAGRHLFAQEATFLLGVAGLEQLPDDALPEVAFAGRSNVGKSSLLNALNGRKTLARTSNTPGRTQQLNFFNLNGRLMLVDMPGYGYAKAPKQQVEAWTRLIKDYLRGRVSLRRLCLLIDARHGVKPIDREIMNLLEAAAVVFQVVMTKVDKVKKVDQLMRSTAATVADYRAGVPEILVTSARRGDGVSELRAEIAKIALDDTLQRP